MSCVIGCPGAGCAAAAWLANPCRSHGNAAWCRCVRAVDVSRRWHILRDGDALTLCRHLPPRFDFAVRALLPRANPLRLAHQIRQDLWRALQSLRGFSPVVALVPEGDGWVVTAGGRSADRIPAPVIARAQAVLNNPNNRARWVRHAREGR